MSTTIADLGRFWKISFDNFGMAPKGIDIIKTSASFEMESKSLGSAPISSENFKEMIFL